MYAPLWCKSSFSFLEGASHPDELIEEAHRLGLPAIAVADRDGVYGIVRAHLKARELGVKLLPGATVTVAAPGAALVPSPVGAARPVPWSAARPVGLHHEPDGDDGGGGGDGGDGGADAVAPMSLARRGRTRRAGRRARAP